MWHQMMNGQNTRKMAAAKIPKPISIDIRNVAGSMS
jgi:hypothetical protein